MPDSGQEPPSPNETQRVVAWGGVALAALAALGLRYAQSVWPLWIALLVFAVAAIPQVFLVKPRPEREAEVRWPVDPSSSLRS